MVRKSQLLLHLDMRRSDRCDSSCPTMPSVTKPMKKYESGLEQKFEIKSVSIYHDEHRVLCRGRHNNGIRHFCLSWSLLCQLEKKEVVSAAGIFASWNICELEYLPAGIFASWNTCQLEYLPAGGFVSTLDSLSPMHAETEGKEPSPSVQLCKVQSRLKIWRGIGERYDTRRNKV